MIIGPLVLALMAALQHSPEGEDVRCITEQITPPERSQIVALTIENADPTPALQTRLEDIGAGCADSRGWTPDDAGNITGLAVAVLMGEETAPRLQRAGIDVAMVDAWLALEVDGGGAPPPVDDATAERLVNALHEAGVPMPTLEANGHLLGVYVGARTMILRVERGLPLQ